MRKATVKLKDGTEFVFEDNFLYIDLNQAVLEGKQFLNIRSSYIRIDSIDWVKIDDIEKEL